MPTSVNTPSDALDLESAAAPTPNPSPGANRLAAALLSASPFAILFANALSVFALTQDDPFITFRYAANLRAGLGLVFNPGQRVEGFSSPLHLLLCCVLSFVFPSVGMLFKAKLAALVFSVLVLVQTRAAAALIGMDRPIGLLAQVLVAANINFAISGVNGLETTLYGYLLMLTFCYFLRECNQAKGNASAMFAALCVLARPDALLLAFFLTLIRIGYGRYRRAGGLFSIAWLVFLTAPVLAEFALRYAYYGQIFPNTYYAKLTSIAVSIPDALKYLYHPVSTTLPRLDSAILFAGFYGLAALGWWPLRRRLAGLLLASFAAAAVLFVLKSGGDWMPGWRFMVPVLPIFALTQAMGIEKLTAILAARSGSSSRPIARMTAAWCVILVALLIWLGGNIRSQHFPWSSVNYSTQDRALIANGLLGTVWIASADFIKTHTYRGSVIAYSEMGYASYANMNTQFLDTRGLVDTQVAQMPQTYKTSVGVTDNDWMTPGDPLYRILVLRQPDFIIALWTSGRTPAVVLGHYHLVDARIPNAVVYSKSP